MTRLATPFLTAAVAASVLVGAPAQAEGSARDHGRARHPVTELVGQFPLPRLRPREVHLSVDRWGYRFQGGAVGNDLTITEVGDGLRYVDRAARRWKALPSTCRRVAVARGVAAQCAIPAEFRDGRIFLEVWPRLGSDRIDATTVSGRYRVWALMDAGDDSVAGGAGADFVNGAFDDDTVSGGAGADWIRAGDGRNRFSGGPGADDLVGGTGRDVVRGGAGRDAVFGGPGPDLLRGDADADTLNGGPGRDVAVRDTGDRVRECEVVRR
ncbi:MAG: hypothetical protein JWN84_4124 [Nocardioides sp.]|nr:hypothetical protein [Nocardioides sp.]